MALKNSRDENVPTYAERMRTPRKCEATILFQRDYVFACTTPARIFCTLLNSAGLTKW